MAHRVAVLGLLSLSIKHVKVERGIYTYRRRAPKDLHPIIGEADIVRSLGTRDPKVAAVAAERVNAACEALWTSLRSGPAGAAAAPGTPAGETREAARLRLKSLGLTPGGAKADPDGWWTIVESLEREHGRAFQEARHDEGADGEQRFLTPVNRETKRLFRDGDGPKVIDMTAARSLYLEHHKRGEDPKFTRDLDAAFDALVASVGDLPVEAYTRAHALVLRDKLFEGKPNADGAPTRLSTSTVRRRLTAITAVFNKARREHGLNIINPFDGLDIPKEGTDIRKTVVFSVAELRTIGQACREKNDARRHIIAIQSDTGARLEEIVGLRVEDIVLAHEVPHVILREDEEADRTFKTAASARKVPLVGEALWGAQQAIAALGTRAKPGVWVFSDYASDTAIKSDSASAALIKWMRTLPGITGNTRSFRHAMKDRLREADVPQVIQNRLLGHSGGSVGETYGEGHSLAKLREHLVKVVLPPLGSS